jgi:hypothetical protein
MASLGDRFPLPQGEIERWVIRGSRLLATLAALLDLFLRSIGKALQCAKAAPLQTSLLAPLA